MRLSNRQGTSDRPRVGSLVETPQSNSRRVDRAQLCPTCGEPLPADARFCPFDGHELGFGSGWESGARPAVQVSELLVGSVVDERYEVLQLLGEGGMGCVFRVRHRVLGRMFALKALRPELAQDFALAERFVQEARAAAAITHPNVVSITDFGILEQGQPYFVMELLEGRTLSSLLREHGVLAPEFVAQLARTVASALSAAHLVGVVHRDLKPDNIVLLGDGSTPTALKVLDFGLAKLSGASRLTFDNIVYGTPQYMSPEQAAGEPIDCRVDVYALGILMYELLTGRVPFEADTYMGVLTKQLYAEPLPLSTLCPDSERDRTLQSIVLRCLAKDRDARYASMLELQLALDQMFNDLSGERPVDSARSRPTMSSLALSSGRSIRRTLRRRRWLVYAAFGVLALGLALLLLYGRLRGGDLSRPDGSSGVPSHEAMVANNADGQTNAAAMALEANAAGDPKRNRGFGRDRGRSAHQPRTVKASGTRAIGADSGRVIGQDQLLPEVRVGETAGGAEGSFATKSKTGSSGIADPWAK